jgi:hypothetical protein
VVGDPNVPSGEVATVEHAAPLLALGTVIVPVSPLGTVPTPGDAPSGNPFGPTDSPGTIPNEEVAPSEGMTVPTWAKAGIPHNKDQAAAMARNGFMQDSPVRAEGLRAAHAQALQPVRQRKRGLSFSSSLTEDELSQ